MMITAEPISQEKVLEFVTDPSAGGIAVFIGKLFMQLLGCGIDTLFFPLGTTRDNFQGIYMYTYMSYKAVDAVTIHPGYGEYCRMEIGRKVVRLEYEAYTAMARKQLHQLCHDARSQWPICKMAIAHRTG